ncbi:MAG: hypothetical protein ACRDHI_12115 [Actinomycetota bacterium]
MSHAPRATMPPPRHRRQRIVAFITAMLTLGLLGGLLVLPGAATAGEGRASAPTRRGEGSGGDSDSGVVPPGGLLTTRDGPINAADPFAIGLKNIGDQALNATIQEEQCDGSQSDELCNKPRVGGVAGNFIFQPVESTTRGLAVSEAVAVAKLFYDRSVLEGVSGFRIFYQKDFSSPVIKLPRCGHGVRTECFQSKRRENGDEIVRVRLSNDPRVTRG